MLIWRSTSPSAVGRLLTSMARSRRPRHPATPTVPMSFNDRPVICSETQLYRLAAALEREAAGQYARFAHALRCQGDAPMANLFHRLASLEVEHLAQVETWARDTDIDTDRPPAFRWDPIEGPPPHLHGLTPRMALAHALHNEERAYAFYRDIAATTPCPTVRAHAEHLAGEELDHVLLLRREQQALRPRALPGQGVPHMDEAQWQALLLGLEADCGRRHQAAAEALRRWRRPALANLFQDMAEDAEAVLRAHGQSARFPRGATVAAHGPDHLLDEECHWMAEVFDRLQRARALAVSHGLATQAQADAARAAGRLARLHDATARLKATA